jgi:hypothetical protein
LEEPGGNGVPPESYKGSTWVLEVYPEAMEAHPGAAKAHHRAVEVHLETMRLALLEVLILKEFTSVVFLSVF